MSSQSTNDSLTAKVPRQGVEDRGVSLPSGLVLVVDADNTLWDTNEVFAHAQLRLLELTEQSVGRAGPQGDRLAFVRAYDQAIAAKHHLHLKYPAQLLVAAIGAGLSGIEPDAAAESAIRGRLLGNALSEHQINDVLAAYSQALSEVPSLLPTVHEGLELARAQRMTVFVMTEGKLDRQRRALAEHGLDTLIASVWEMTKTTAQFERIRQRFAPGDVVVIGDQVDRDISPSHDAGCKTVLVPGRFQPRWGGARDAQTADHVASTFLAAVEWVARELGARREPSRDCA